MARGLCNRVEDSTAYLRWLFSGLSSQWGLNCGVGSSVGSAVNGASIVCSFVTLAAWRSRRLSCCSSYRTRGLCNRVEDSTAYIRWPLSLHCGLDNEFEERSKSNNRLQSVFESMPGPRDSPHSKRVHKEADDIAMKYTKHALSNRARFACTQKFSLNKFQREIPSETQKQLAERAVNAELEYVSNLF
jgi:hypothetical protein